MRKTLMSVLRVIYKKRQIIVNTLALLFAIVYFIYGLGYTSNWAGIISATRGGNFFNASQQANRTMVNLGFVTLILILLNMTMGSFKRKKYYFSNFLLSIITSILMIVSSFITIYYNSILERMYERITEDEVPAYLYASHGAGEKSYAIFQQGNILSYIMLVIAVILILFTINKHAVQKERAKLVKEMLVHEL